MKVTFSALGSFVVLAAIVRALPKSSRICADYCSFLTCLFNIHTQWLRSLPFADPFGLMHDDLFRLDVP